ncbi:SusC/RagA family TonB-linked outer membrane protein [Fibrella sp. ES10-3-2-2]|nr:SusC/RagA family protein [Fibrella sp. ES10-3-2-2]
MKHLVVTTSVCALLTLSTLGLQAQTNPKVEVRSVVRNAEGKPLPNALISANAGQEQTTTDSLGAFSLAVAPKSVVQVSAEGYQAHVAVADTNMREIILAGIDETANLVNVAFRKVNRKDLLGGVSAVNVPALLQKNYTTGALDNLSAFVGGFNGNIWGMGEYMVLIDGVPRSATADVHATEIEQITVLKGAAALALYGSRAAKGVIQITTKRGVANEKRINVRVNTGLHVPKGYPDYVGSAEYMTLYNEARRNDGLAQLYTPETIWNHYSGVNPYRYPNVDYYSPEYLRKVSNRTDAITEISGGNSRARFYTNIGFAHSNSLINFGEAKKDNNTRLNVRGNVDVRLNDKITTSVDASAIFSNNRSAHGNYWSNAATLRPYRFSPLIPISMIEENDPQSQIQVQNSNYLIDGKYLLGGTQQHLTNPFADIYAAGYNQGTTRQFQFTNAINIDLGSTLPGLSFGTRIGVDYSSSYNLAFTNQYAIYSPTWNNYAGNDLISSMQKFGEDRNNGTQNVSNSWRQQTLFFSGQFNYATRINNVHNINAILVGTGHQRTETAVYHATQSHMNMGLQVAYNYRQKYYLDFSGNMLYSAKLPPGNRTAFSPTLSAGWRISEEGFLAGSSVVNDLKLTASAGILHTDLDIPGYYLYKGIFTHADGTWYSWRDGSLTRTTDSRRGENNDLFFAKRKDINVGLEGSFFQRLISLNANYFFSRMDGIITQAATIYPNYFVTGFPQSSFLPYVNYNNDQRSGVDFNLALNKQLGQVAWTVGVTGTFYNSKVIQRAENFENAYQNRVGKPLDAIFGLQSNGLFANESDIAASATQSYGQVKPGDIKYVDQNGDKIIDSRDEVYLGRAGWNGSPVTFGVHLTAKWKNWTFFTIATGNEGAYSQKNNSYFWIRGDDKYSAAVRDRWTPETAATATYPRLTSLNNDNNIRTSDFWLYRNNRINLSRVQITYALPSRLLAGKFVRDLSIYASGADLLTVAKERQIMETTIGGAPQTRFFNLGLNAAF